MKTQSNYFKTNTWKSCSFLSLVNDGEGDNGLGKDPLRWDELSEGEWAGRVVLVELEVPLSVPGPNPGVTDLYYKVIKKIEQ